MVSRVSGIFLAAALLVSSILVAAPAVAEAPFWSAEPTPGMTDYVLGPAGIDIRDLAAADDGLTLYAVTGDSLPAAAMYKSTDGGLNWTALDIPVTGDLVSVAPDNADIVAVARKEAPVVYVSSDGGSSWKSLGEVRTEDNAAASIIHAIAISSASQEIRFIAVAGEEAGNIGNVWYTTTEGPVSAWEETGGLPGFQSASTIKSVAFSPGFSADKILVTAGESDNQSVYLGIFSFAERKWNRSAGFTGYPVTVISNEGITGLTSASIALNPKYQGGDETTRIAFLGLTVDGDIDARATSGIYRLTDTAVKALKPGVNIHSITFDGPYLIAGAHDSNIIYRSTNPMAATPSVKPTPPLKSPGGENQVVVVSSGQGVVAGTSGNESALAISRNDGRTFNDISLIDTSLINLTDIAVAADDSQVYLVTDDGTDLSLWRKTSSWERVLSQPDTTGYIIRTAPEDANVVYLAKKGAKTIYFNQDAGETEWLVRTCNVNIQDLAVESPDVIYALNREGKVVRSSTAGNIWGTAVSTGLDTDTGHMIISAGQDNLLVGSTNGYVAYSTDGNTSWNKIPKILHGAAREIQVIADGNLATNKIIYAASSKGSQKIKKWTIGSSSDWTEIFGSIVPGGIYGLAMDSGTLYALEFDPRRNQSTLWRLLWSATGAGTSSDWKSYSTTTGTDVVDSQIHLNAAPQALRSSSMGKLWAIKTNDTERLYSLVDIMTELTLESPEPDFISPVNSVTGIVNEISFRWQRWDVATGYELNIASDPEFTEPVIKIAVDSELATVIVRVGPNRNGDARVYFNLGTTYYWKVKVTQPLRNLYSETRSFTIESLEAPPPAVIRLLPPLINLPPPLIKLPQQPDIVIQWPDIIVPPAPVTPPQKIVLSPAPVTPVPVTPAYIWAIIGFGAALVIAVLTVIVRTWGPGGLKPIKVEGSEDTGDIVAWVKHYLGVDSPNSEMTDEEIRRVIRLLTKQAPDTTWSHEKPVLGRIGSGSITLIIKAEFPEYYAKYNLGETDSALSDTREEKQ
jgi:photosystem II stability/assembly factor-like uncharacterized protein